MFKQVGLIFGLLCILSFSANAVETGGDPQTYTITQNWDNTTADDAPEVHITFGSSISDNETMHGLLITVDAPFYNNTVPEGEPGYFEGLWDYEVVEVFLLGSEEKYLEIELGPAGHYLTYFLEGIRNVTNDTLPIAYWAINETSMRWTGSAVIPLSYLPVNLNKFNAYAIHNLTVEGAEDERRYMALFPVPTGEFPEPDFHKLEYFEDIDLTEIMNNVNNGVSPNQVGLSVLLIAVLGTFNSWA